MTQDVYYYETPETLREFFGQLLKIFIEIVFSNTFYFINQIEKVLFLID